MANGIYLRWTSPAEDTVSFSVYRGRTDDPSLARRILDSIPLRSPSTVDVSPSVTDHYYWVVAVDGAGNESPWSERVYVSPGLLPVQNLGVIQIDALSPVLSWTHPAPDIEGFNCTLDSYGLELPLHDGLLTTGNFTDTGWSGDERRYLVQAVDAQGGGACRPGYRAPKLFRTFLQRGSLAQQSSSELYGLRWPQ